MRSSVAWEGDNIGVEVIVHSFPGDASSKEQSVVLRERVIDSRSVQINGFMRRGGKSKSFGIDAVATRRVIGLWIGTRANKGQQLRIRPHSLRIEGGYLRWS